MGLIQDKFVRTRIFKGDIVHDDHLLYRKLSYFASGPVALTVIGDRAVMDLILQIVADVIQKRLKVGDAGQVVVYSVGAR